MTLGTLLPPKFGWFLFTNKKIWVMLSDGYKAVLDQVAGEIAKEVLTKAPEMDRGKLVEMGDIVVG
jgi:TRAP-type C4-dicarboxylate transport system substrate-binding protein